MGKGEIARRAQVSADWVGTDEYQYVNSLNQWFYVYEMDTNGMYFPSRTVPRHGPHLVHLHFRGYLRPLYGEHAEHYHWTESQWESAWHLAHQKVSEECARLGLTEYRPSRRTIERGQCEAEYWYAYQVEDPL